MSKHAFFMQHMPVSKGLVKVSDKGAKTIFIHGTPMSLDEVKSINYNHQKKI